MATLNEIENFLNIEIGDRRLRAGKKYEDKNKYYYYNELYYIVELTQGKWMICSDNRETRQLLRDNCWFNSHEGYARTTTNERTTKFYHQLYLNYAEELVADHTNRHKFDNRSENLRIVTRRQNMRNKTTNKNNTSGKMGVCRRMKRGKPHWNACINGNDGKYIQRSFNINILGNDEAFRRAVQCRRDMEVQYDYRGE
jgi:hypothetical protein